MKSLFGFTRAVVKPRYALLTPDGFVNGALPGWSGATCVVLISPALGAKFAQVLITLAPDGRGVGHTDGMEFFAYVLDGECTLTLSRKKHHLMNGSFAFLPPLTDYTFSNAALGTRLLMFQKVYQPLDGLKDSEAIIDQASEHPGVPFQGDADARLQTLLPDTPEFDMAVNIFTYRPGATLPMVETHIMEHGMMILSGQGIYRLDHDWHPVKAGDVIWLAPYCPQWFAALGQTPASYIYYKDVNRSPM
jgi:(S)-ureidoglycine aminohydrolase